MIVARAPGRAPDGVVRRVGSDSVAAVAELMERMLQGVFNEPDPERRDTAIAETFAEDVVFTDAEGTVTGRAALAAKVTALLDQGPGLVFSHDGPLREIPGIAGGARLAARAAGRRSCARRPGRRGGPRRAHRHAVHGARRRSGLTAPRFGNR